MRFPMPRETKHIRLVDEYKEGLSVPEINVKYGSEKHIDYRECAGPFSKQYGCSVCIKECTFFKSDYYKIYKAYLKKQERTKGECRNGSQ